MLIFASVPAQAAIFWWDGGVVDIPGAGEGVSLGGSGDWSTAIANWDDGLGHVVWPSVGTDNSAILGGTAGTVGLTTPIALQNLTFETAGYTVAGAGANVLTFGGTTPTITNGTGISATISSPISGATVTKAGAGVLTLSGVNTNTGLTVSAGTLQLSGAGTLGASGATLIVSPGATVNLNGTNQTIAIGTGTGTIANNSGSGTSTLTINAPGTGGPLIVDSTANPGGKVAVVIAVTNNQTLNTANSYTGGTTVNAGVYLYIGTGLGAGSGTINLATTTSGVLFNGVTVANDITGPGYIFDNVNGAATVTFTGTVNTSGNIIFRNAGNIYNFASSRDSVSTGIVGGLGGPNQNSAAGAIIKSGAGTLTFAGANIYTGTTTVNGGVLKIKSNTGLGTVAGGTTVASGAVLYFEGNLTIGAEALTIGGGGIANAGALRNVSGTTTYAGTVALSGSTRFTMEAGTLTLNGNVTTSAVDRSFIVNGNGNMVVNGALGMTGTGGVIKDAFSIGGAGTLTLGGTNTFTGATTVLAGTLRLNYATNNTTKLANAAALILGGGTVELSGGSHPEVVVSTTLTVGTLSIVNQTGGTSTLQMNAVTPAGGMLKFGAASIATTDTLNTNGILPWATIGNTWATNSTNAADGAITAYAAYSDVARLGGVIPDGAANNVRIINGGVSGSVTLTASPLNQLNSLEMDASDGAATIAAANAGDVIMVGTDVGGTVWQTSTAGGLTLGATANHGILTTGGTDNATAATLTLLNENGTTALTINSAIANNGTDVVSVSKMGSGLVRLAGNNTYTGVITVGGGTLALAGSNVGATGNTTIGAAGTLRLESADALGNTGVTNSQLLFGSLGGGTLALRADSATTFAGTSGIGGLNTATVNFDVNQLTGAGSNQKLTINTGVSNYAAAVTLNITGGNGYSLALGTIQNVGSGSTLLINPTTAKVSLTAYTAQNSGARASTLILGGTATGNVIEGAIINPPSPGTGVTTLSKIGTSTWELAGANTYTGTTTVSDGTLLVSGSLTGSAVTVSGTGILGGGTTATPGTITGAVSVTSGGKLAPGTSIGALNTGALSFTGAATFALEINSTTLTSDLVSSSDTLSLSFGGPVTLTIQDLSPTPLTNATFTFISYASLGWNGGLFNVGGTIISDYDATTNPNSTTFFVSGNEYHIDYNLNDNSVALVAVPEPGAAVTLLGGIAVLLGLRRRRA